MRARLILLGILGLLWSTSASAGDNDFRLYRLSSCREGTMPGSTCQAMPNIQAFKDLSKSLGLVFAPSFLSPSESLGEAGFAIGFETKFSVAASGSHWNALDGVDDESPPLFTLLQLHGRKGLPFSFELDMAASWLVDSEMVYLGGGLKWSLMEGWLVLPDLSVRGHGGTVTGSPDMNLTTAGFDVSLSKSFGLGGVFSVTPYAGYSHVWIISSSRVIDADPGFGATPSGGYSPEFVFEQENQNTSRGFVGLRFIVDYFTFTAEGNFSSDVQNYALNIGADF
ncbi:MAG: hypothetical protein AUK47_18585 [Deltaproteobacteria bacterium CG2_30_63_29]|nr:MAG: hypothetical protein AUK47_18585 [Deltaproteobacteria bacterium CG2_30_63_29]PJB37483.1 MAG: hypothetical protein CO108_21050 [Deltaproteobacteria bacterium CG_4_9_14_3_um_filter_63_12]